MLATELLGYPYISLKACEADTLPCDASHPLLCGTETPCPLVKPVTLALSNRVHQVTSVASTPSCLFASHIANSRVMFLVSMSFLRLECYCPCDTETTPAQGRHRTHTICSSCSFAHPHPHQRKRYKHRARLRLIRRRPGNLPIGQTRPTLRAAEDSLAVVAIGSEPTAILHSVEVQ